MNARQASYERGIAYLDALPAMRVSDDEIRQWIPPEVESAIKPPAAYIQEVMDLLNKRGATGDGLPWPKTHSSFRFRPGEVTLWHGINGHGKSAITTQVALWLALRGVNSCLASFEMLPERTLERMVKQCAGNPEPTDMFTIRLLTHLTRKIWLYDHKGRVDPQLLLQAIRYTVAEKGVTHFFVDSLMKCVRGSDDYNGQKNFIEDICAVAHETKAHIHLIHHVRKGEDEKSVPNKFDARGAGEITDQVDNVLAVWRNKAKEKERDECLKVGAALNNETPDFLLVCDKQRNGGWEGNWALWGDVRSWHFRESAKEAWMRGYEVPEVA